VRILRRLSISSILLTACLSAQTIDLSNRVVYNMISASSKEIFVATDSGIYRSTNSGDTWEATNTGLTLLATKGLCIDSAGVLFLGVAGQVFRSSKTVVITSASEAYTIVPQEFFLEQNYPNPFNPSTTLRFSLSRPGYVTLKVFNVLGEAVATLLDGQLNQGWYTERWDALDHPSGIYFCRLQVSRIVQTRKLVLIK